MAIILDDPNTTTRYPVLKHRKIGEQYFGMLIKTPEQRDQQKKDDRTGVIGPIPNGRGGFRKELVVTLLTLPGTTMTAGPELEPVTVAEGDIVRLILKGKAYGTWIDADKALPGRQVGDVVWTNTTYGQAYDANGQPHGGTLASDAECDAIPRGITVGRYGDLAIRRANPDETPWVTKAEAAYHADKAVIALDDAPAADVPAVFGAPTDRPHGF